MFGKDWHTHWVRGQLITPEVWGSGHQVGPIKAVVEGSWGRSLHVWGESYNPKALWPLTHCCLPALWQCNPLSLISLAQHVKSCEGVEVFYVFDSAFPLKLKAGKVGSGLGWGVRYSSQEHKEYRNSAKWNWLSSYVWVQIRAGAGWWNTLATPCRPSLFCTAWLRKAISLLQSPLLELQPIRKHPYNPLHQSEEPAYWVTSGVWCGTNFYTFLTCFCGIKHQPSQLT